MSRSSFKLICLLVTAAYGALGATTAASLPTVFVSPLDDGVSIESDVVAPVGPVALPIYFDADEGYFEFALFLDSAGLDLLAFTPDPTIDPADVVFAPGIAGTLSVLGGNPIDEILGPVRLGELIVSTTDVGTLFVGSRPPEPSSAFVRSLDFSLVSVPDQLVVTVVVPEPSSLLLIGLGLGLAGLRARR